MEATTNIKPEYINVSRGRAGLYKMPVMSELPLAHRNTPTAKIISLLSRTSKAVNEDRNLQHQISIVLHCQFPNASTASIVPRGENTTSLKAIYRTEVAEESVSMYSSDVALPPDASWSAAPGASESGQRNALKSSTTESLKELGRHWNVSQPFSAGEKIASGRKNS